MLPFICCTSKSACNFAAILFKFEFSATFSVNSLLTESKAIISTRTSNGYNLPNAHLHSQTNIQKNKKVIGFEKYGLVVRRFNVHQGAYIYSISTP